jgi:cytochrome c-type biogenesis protein CcmH/NrfG
MAEERAYLTAAVGLERAAPPSAAAAAYAAATTRWPTSLGAWIGLGNARFAQGDLEGAAVAFGEAVRLHPASSAARHNLAETLDRLGRGEPPQPTGRAAPDR